MKAPRKLSSAVFGDEEEEGPMSTSSKAAANQSPQVSFKPKTSSLESVSCEMAALRTTNSLQKTVPALYFTPIMLFYIIVVIS